MTAASEMNDMLDERMSASELQDAVYHDAATIVVAYALGCEFKDCCLDDDGAKWPTSVSRIELNYPDDWTRAEAIALVAVIHEAGPMAVAKLHGRGPHRVNESPTSEMLDDSKLWEAVEALAKFIESNDEDDGCYGALGTDGRMASPPLPLPSGVVELRPGEDSGAIELMRRMGLDEWRRKGKRLAK
jgi:hypothetical protein